MGTLEAGVGAILQVSPGSAIIGRRQGRCRPEHRRNTVQRFKIETWGCQMNEYDSQKMAGLLKQHGLLEVQDEEDADVFILNTCSVREKAAHKLFSRIGMLRKRYGKDRIVGVCGCVASQEARNLFERTPDIHFVLGTRSTHLIHDAIRAAAMGRRFLDTGDHSESMRLATRAVDRQQRIKAFVAIMEGCDNFCTYCIVPYTRGRERSRPLQEILDEVRRAVEEDGVCEIELLGQNVNSYRHNDWRFHDVLDRVSRVPGVARVRFLTSHPKDFDAELADLIAEKPNICSTIHLPMQSGSDRILKLMGRRYTRNQYLEKIQMIRERIPGVALSGDFIVGFPGETEEDFGHTMDVVRAVQYDNIFSFLYSPRPGTAALKLKEPPVPAEEARRRLESLQRTQEAIQLTKHERMIGRTVDILIESVSKKNPNRLTGRTEGNHVVHVDAGRGDALIGSILPARITGATLASLTGELTRYPQGSA